MQIPSNPKPGQELLREPQVATLFGITPRTLITWRQRGLIPFIRIGRNIFFKRESIERMLERLEHGAGL